MPWQKFSQKDNNNIAEMGLVKPYIAIFGMRTKNHFWKTPLILFIYIFPFIIFPFNSFYFLLYSPLLFFPHINGQ